MRSTSAAASAAVVLLSLGLLAGCGGDESADPDPSAATEEQRAECEAEVEVTGAAKAAWTGDAFVVTENRSGPTVYKTTNGPNTLTLLSADGDFPAVASLATMKNSFSGSEGTLEVDEDGAGATVESTLKAGSGKSADLVATFTC